MQVPRAVGHLKNDRSDKFCGACLDVPGLPGDELPVSILERGRSKHHIVRNSYRLFELVVQGKADMELAGGSIGSRPEVDTRRKPGVKDLGNQGG